MAGEGYISMAKSYVARVPGNRQSKVFSTSIDLYHCEIRPLSAQLEKRIGVDKPQSAMVTSSLPGMLLTECSLPLNCSRGGFLCWLLVELVG